MWDIVGLDRPCVDIVVNVDRFPRPNGRTAAQAILFQGGGKAATGLCAASRLGAKCALMGTVGEDSWAELCVREAQAFGVDASRLIRREGHDTSMSVVISDKESRGRSIINHRSMGPTLTFEEMDRELLEHTRFLYLPWLDEAFARAAAVVRENGGRVMLDADSNTRHLDEYLPLIDILIGSESLYKSRFAQSGDPEEDCLNVRALGPDLVLFTLGEKGAMGCDGRGFFVQPAFHLPVVDTLGAGDVFHGVFLTGLIAGMKTPEAARLACAASSLKCMMPGARSGIPDWDVVNQLIETGTWDAQAFKEQEEREAEAAKCIRHTSLWA